VGIDVASEPASRDGEGGALDGLLHEERPLGRAGERSGARASCAADEGGDGHCEGVVCGVGRSGDGRVGLLFFELCCFAGLGRVAEVQTATHWKLSGWRLGRKGRARASIGRKGRKRSGFAYNLLYFCFHEEDEYMILSKIL
jgi:hypothetical protein